MKHKTNGASNAQVDKVPPPAGRADDAAKLRSNRIASAESEPTAPDRSIELHRAQTAVAAAQSEKASSAVKAAKADRASSAAQTAKADRASSAAQAAKADRSSSAAQAAKADRASSAVKTAKADRASLAAQTAKADRASSAAQAAKAERASSATKSANAPNTAVKPKAADECRPNPRRGQPTTCRVSRNPRFARRGCHMAQWEDCARAIGCGWTSVACRCAISVRGGRMSA